MNIRTFGVWLLVACVPACFEDGDALGPSGEEGGEAGDGAKDDAPGMGDGTADGASAGALAGRYDAELLTLSCSGSCAVPTATSLLGPLSYCDVGDSDYESLDVSHGDGTLTIDLDRGRTEGSVDGDGAFAVSGRATEAGGGVNIDASIWGTFLGRHGGFTGTLSFHAKGDHYGDAIDCRGEMEVVAGWVSDACEGNANACSDAFPICYQDVCYAGTAEDPCDDDEHCADGLVCHAGACLEPAPLGGACEYDERECAGDLRCFDDVCQAGEPGDPCHFDDDCAGDHVCATTECSAGELGDACGYDDDCDDALLCVFDVCSAGEPGDTCDWNDDCVSNDCVDGVCG